VVSQRYSYLLFLFHFLIFFLQYQHYYSFPWSPAAGRHAARVAQSRVLFVLPPHHKLLRDWLRYDQRQDPPRRRCLVRSGGLGNAVRLRPRQRALRACQVCQDAGPAKTHRESDQGEGCLHLQEAQELC
jgi:hypothetical protein